MSLFLCLTCPDGERVPDVARARYLAHPVCTGLQVRCEQFGGLWVMLGTNDVGPDPGIAGTASWIGAGTVRLDDREATARLVAGAPTGLTDLELLVRAVEARGPQLLTRTFGDFAVVLFDRQSRTLIAVRDPLGVHPLCHSAVGERLACCSSAALLAPVEHYDADYLAAFVANATIRPEHTPYPGVLALPAGHLLSGTRGGTRVQRYWDPEHYAGDVDDTRTATDLDALVDGFRTRFFAAVARRLSGRGDVWAQLSGGMDSSSVVSVAALARPSGLAGTITLADRRGTGGDERTYADAVVARYGLRNEQLVDSEWWWDDGAPPPLTDFPTPSYLVFGRDRRLATIVRAAGGRVVLSGYGSDQYLGGSAIFFADWLSARHVGATVREMARWAMIGRVSFWKLALHNAIAPLLPSMVRSRVVPAAQTPPWLRRAFASRFAGHQSLQRAYDGPLGRKYRTDIIQSLTAMPDVLAHHAVIQGVVEERHPFLDRELVEFALALPASACAQPGARKWILREAMRGILPESIRTRRGKGSVDGRASWTLAHRRGMIEAWLQDPILGQLGCVEPGSLRASLGPAVNGSEHLRSNIIRTLALETWLRARAGLPVTVGARRGSKSRQPVSLV